MSNCKPGDIARIVGGLIENQGRLVRVVQAVQLIGLFGNDVWEVEALQTVACRNLNDDHYDAPRSSMCIISDKYLRPLYDGDGQDETLSDEWAGKPKKTPIKVTSEYEAAKIAETTPGAHVQVVRDAVLVSEFFGEA